MFLYNIVRQVCDSIIIAKYENHLTGILLGGFLFSKVIVSCIPVRSMTGEGLPVRI